MEAPEHKAIAEQRVICLPHRGRYDDIGALFRALYVWADEHEVEVVGPGFAVFRAAPKPEEPDAAEFDVCLPVAGEPEGDARVQVRRLPACTVASATVKGPYGQVTRRYTELYAWLSAEGLSAAGPPREVYLKHPGADGSGDPETYVTEIQIPIGD